MKALIRITVLALVTSVAIPFTAEINTGVGYVAAAESDRDRRRKKTRRVPTISESVYKRLGEAQEFIDAKEYGEAKDLLLNLVNRRTKYNGNEHGNMYNMLGYIFFLEENYTEAVKYYTLVLEQGEDIQEGLEVTTLYTVAQLSFVMERYQDALKYMETWISKAENPGPEPRIFMGQVYYQMKDYDNALKFIELAIDLAIERGTEPKENWYTLVGFLYFEKEEWPKFIDTMEILVEKFPKRTYWIQLAGVYGQQGQEAKQLNTMQAAYAGEYLDTEGDYTTLAGLLMQREAPYKAAKIMVDGFDKKIIERTERNLQSLGQAWQLAQEVEEAIPVFEEAAATAEDGKIYERLAYLYLEDDAFEKCVTAANGALDKGGLRKKQTVYIVRGMCQFNQNQLTGARGSFVSCRSEARREEDTSNQRICAQWITFIDREADRLAQLEASGG